MLNRHRTLSRRIKRATYFIGALSCLGFSIAIASVLDDFGPPPPGDPSEFTGPSIGEEFAIDFLETQPPASEGAFDGGNTGTPEDAGENNAVPEDEQNSNGKFVIPTG